jgi:adenylate kinase
MNKQGMLIVVGGIHGVGKSTTCKRVCDKFNINYLSASSIINEEATPHINNSGLKIVQDVPANQFKLVSAINKMRRKDANYLLDGHFVLIGGDGNFHRIDMNIYQSIAPASVIVLVDEITNIRLRLLSRDLHEYSQETLRLMQDEEVMHGQAVAANLNISANVLSVTRQDEIEAVVKKIINTL